MQYSVTYPLVAHPHDPEMVTGEAIAQFSRAAELAGFAGIGFTDHPAPADRWFNAGGHDALDPFVALTWAAATTTELRLMPNILVLPYRNPFLVAKAAATLDVLSGGRFILAVATGYLKGEYRALGVDFAERNDLFDEAIEVIRGVWSTDDYAYEGRHFTAFGQTANPKPAAAPPVWIGGNSQLSRRRVAEYGNGWKPFHAARTTATTVKTPALETTEDLAEMLQYLWQQVDDAGRDRSEIDISFGTGAGGHPGRDGFDPGAKLEAIEELAALGVTWIDVWIPADSLDQSIEALEEFGETVIGGR